MEGGGRSLRTIDQLHPYQQAAIDFLYEHNAALALMPVGAGKTVTTMTALKELMDDGVVRCPIVFAPLRVAQLVWPTEGAQWDHLKDIEMVCWGGEPRSWPDSSVPWRTSRILWGQRTNAENRLPGIRDPRKRRVLEDRSKQVTETERKLNKVLRKVRPPNKIHVTSYENLSWICELYEPGESPFDCWVFDEIGKLKNPKSPRYKAVRKHTAKASMVWGLNATPAPEGLLDLFAQVNVVDGGKLWGGSYYAWRQKYFMPADYMGYTWTPQYMSEQRLLDDLNTLAFRVDERQLAYQSTISHSQIVVELPPKARAAYDEMEKKMALAIEGREDIVAMSAASASMKLRQITNGFIYDETGHAEILHEEKQHALADLIDSMGREPLLCIYEFAQDLEAIRRIWKNVPYLGQGLSSVAAADTINRWNKRELPVMALHPLSAGHGVNLQAGGNHVCWYSIPWSLESYLQANGRVDRQGQKRACFGHHIIALDSKDQDVSNALMEKDVTQARIIEAIRRV